MVGSGFRFVVVAFDRIGWDGMDLAGDGLGLGGGTGDGVGGGDRVDATPKSVGLSNLGKESGKKHVKLFKEVIQFR